MSDSSWPIEKVFENTRWWLKEEESPIRSIFMDRGDQRVVKRKEDSVIR